MRAPLTRVASHHLASQSESQLRLRWDAGKEEGAAGDRDPHCVPGLARALKKFDESLHGPRACRYLVLSPGLLLLGL